MKEFFGKDEQQALAKASEALGLKKEQIAYRTVTGLVAGGKHQAGVAIIVEADPPAPLDRLGLPTEMEEEARQAGGERWVVSWCAGVLRRMGLDQRIDVARVGEDTVLRVDFTGGKPAMNRGAMRGLRGAMQHLVGRLANLRETQPQRYLVDLCGTLDERKHKMDYLVSQLKRYLRDESRWIGIHLMESQDRGLLHTALKREGLDSESQGEGSFRILCVKKQVG